MQQSSQEPQPNARQFGANDGKLPPQIGSTKPHRKHFAKRLHYTSTRYFGDGNTFFPSLRLPQIASKWKNRNPTLGANLPAIVRSPLRRTHVSRTLQKTLRILSFPLPLFCAPALACKCCQFRFRYLQHPVAIEEDQMTTQYELHHSLSIWLIRL